MDEYLQIIGNYGFPIFVALYFMLRMEKILRQNTDVMIQIKQVIHACKKN